MRLWWFEVNFPYCFLQTSNSFHGVVDSWKRFPKKGIPLGQEAACAFVMLDGSDQIDGREQYSKRELLTKPCGKTLACCHGDLSQRG